MVHVLDEGGFCGSMEFGLSVGLCDGNVGMGLNSVDGEGLEMGEFGVRDMGKSGLVSLGLGIWGSWV